MDKKRLTTLKLVMAAVVAFVMMSPAVAQEQEVSDDNYVPVIAYFGKNDTTYFCETHSRFKIINSDTIFDYNYEFTYSLAVIDSTANSYTIKYLPGDISCLDGRNINPQFLPAFASVMPTELTFITDECGAVKHIVEWEKLSKAIGEGLSAALGNLSPEVAENIKNNKIFDVSSEEVLLQRFTPANLLFCAHGVGYQLGMTETNDSTATGKSNTKVFAEYLNEEEAEFEGDYRIITSTRSELPTEAVTETVSSLLTDMASTSRKKEEINDAIKQIDKVEVTVSHLLQYFVNGWPMFIQKVTDVETMGTIRKDITTIECTGYHW